MPLPKDMPLWPSADIFVRLTHSNVVKNTIYASLGIDGRKIS
ncbi:hypothetical protein ACLK1T_13700 [Escherichia coli]